MTRYSAEVESSARSCKTSGSDVRVHFKNTRETAQAIKVSCYLIFWLRFLRLSLFEFCKFSNYFVAFTFELSKTRKFAGMNGPALTVAIRFTRRFNIRLFRACTCTKLSHTWRLLLLTSDASPSNASVVVLDVPVRNGSNLIFLIFELRDLLRHAHSRYPEALFS